jgi:hypothetical protein
MRAVCSRWAAWSSPECWPWIRISQVSSVQLPAHPDDDADTQIACISGPFSTVEYSIPPGPYADYLGELCSLGYNIPTLYAKG